MFVGPMGLSFSWPLPHWLHICLQARGMAVRLRVGTTKQHVLFGVEHCFEVFKTLDSQF